MAGVDAVESGQASCVREPSRESREVNRLAVTPRLTPKAGAPQLPAQNVISAYGFGSLSTSGSTEYSCPFFVTLTEYL